METKRPLKVCMIAPHFPPEFGWYGTGRDCMELALELSERGHQLEVIACAEKMDVGEIYQDGIKVIRISWVNSAASGSLISHSLPQARLMMNMNLAFWEAFLQASKNTEYDVIDTSLVSAESLFASILSEVPVVARVHDRLPEFLQKELASMGDSGFRFERQLADSLRMISNGWVNSRTAVGNGTAADSAGQLNYSLDTSAFSPEGLSALDTQGRPSLLIHTSIENEKYKHLVNDIVTKVKEEIPDLWLTIVAHDIFSEVSEGKMRESLKADGIACDMAINHNISRLIMPGLWRSSWCGLILDWRALAPYAVLEPLACGTPIVVETALADTAFLKQTALLNELQEFSADAVVEKIVSILKTESLRKEQGTAAREYILANHCRKANGEKVLKAYQEVIDRFKTRERTARIVSMELFLSQCRSLCEGFNQWLYDLLYFRSFRFRLSHWLKKFRKIEVADRSEVS